MVKFEPSITIGYLLSPLQNLFYAFKTFETLNAQKCVFPQL